MAQVPPRKLGEPALTFHAVTDVGRGREQNEDACGEVSAAGGELLVVCDGMGGHESGEVASRIAVDAIMQIFQNSPSSDPAERLKNGFLVANQRILAHAEKAGLDGMGTTAVAAFVKDGEAWIAHVGDSRCYHLRGDSVLWRTADHTRVQKMIDRGILTPEQAKTHEDANVVTRALGFARGEEQPEPDIAAGRELRDGDLLLLCSDGLYDLVKDEEIAELGSEDEPAEAAQRLVDLANRRGGHDNITVTIVRYGAAAKRVGGARKTDLDEPGPAAGSSAMKTTDVAKSAAAAREIVAREKAKEAAAKEAPSDPQSKKALGLVIAGVALVGIAAAVFLLTRGGDGEPTKNPARDAGAASTNSGSGDPADVDAGAGSAAGSVDGGTLTAPTWGTPDRPRPPGGGSAKKGGGAGSGSAGAGSASPGAGSGSGTAAPGSGSGSAAGSGGGGGFASKLGVGGGTGATAGSGTTAGSATPKAPPGPPAVPPTTPQTPPAPTTTPKQPATAPATPPKQPATTTPTTPKQPATGSGAK